MRLPSLRPHEHVPRVTGQEATCTYEHTCEKPEVSLRSQPWDIAHPAVETGTLVGLVPVP